MTTNAIITEDGPNHFRITFEGAPNNAEASVTKVGPIPIEGPEAIAAEIAGVELENLEDLGVGEILVGNGYLRRGRVLGQAFPVDANGRRLNSFGTLVTFYYEP